MFKKSPKIWSSKNFKKSYANSQQPTANSQQPTANSQTTPPLPQRAYHKSAGVHPLSVCFCLSILVG